MKYKDKVREALASIRKQMVEGSWVTNTFDPVDIDSHIHSYHGKQLGGYVRAERYLRAMKKSAAIGIHSKYMVEHDSFKQKKIDIHNWRFLSPVEIAQRKVKEAQANSDLQREISQII